jgi:hypothetical protein
MKNDLYLYLGNCAVENQKKWFVIRMENSLRGGRVIARAEKSPWDLGHYGGNWAIPPSDEGYCSFHKITESVLENMISERKIFKEVLPEFLKTFDVEITATVRKTIRAQGITEEDAITEAHETFDTSCTGSDEDYRQETGEVKRVLDD